MQPTTASPRDSLTAAQVEALITGDAVQIDCGLEVVDADGDLVQDWTEHLIASGSSVSWEHGRIHRRCVIHMTQSFGFGALRMRPYVTLTDGGVSARFDLGEFVPVRAVRRFDAATGVVFTVEGVDRLVLMDTPIGEGYRIAALQVFIDEVEDLIEAIDPDTSPTLLADGNSNTATLPADRVWEAATSNTYLSVANELLAAIGYEPLWVDFKGVYRTQEYRAPSTRTSEWTYDFTADSLGGAERSEEADWWHVPNRWIFVRDRPAVGVADTATDGSDGRYEVANETDGDSSSGSRGGIVRRAIVRVDAADADGLTEQADAMVARDKRVIAYRTLTVEPNPLHGHDDIVTITDDELGSGLAIVRAWTIPLDGLAMALTVEML